MPIIKLTPQFIATSLVCPPEKTRVELCDSEIPGLYIAVRAASPGEGVYYLRWKDANNKTCHTKLGRTIDIDLAEARKAAKQLRAEIALGANPQAKAKAEKAVLTLSEFFDHHYLPYVKPRKRSWRRDEELYRLRIREKFGNRRLNQISRQQIQMFHTEVLASGLAPGTADHHLRFLKHAFNLAIDWGLLAEKNPAARIPLFAVDNKVENYLDDDQLEDLLTVLRTDANRPVCQIALFLVSSGVRLNEALRATWSQIDKENRVLKIPASNSKSKRIRSVPLNDAALEVLAQLDTEGKYDHAFVSKTGKPYTTIMKVWTRLLTRPACLTYACMTCGTPMRASW
jgi:integrase